MTAAPMPSFTGGSAQASLDSFNDTKISNNVGSGWTINRAGGGSNNNGGNFDNIAIVAILILGFLIWKN